MLYFYEALVLILASCILGCMIGMTVGYVMTLEYTVFNESTLEFFFPWQQFIVILISGIACAALSTFTPTGILLKK